ncbi:MAG: 5-oxoprolinase subunit PxpB [Eubacteriales bacterium]
MPEAKILICGDSALTVKLGDKISPETGRAVRALFSALSKKKADGITDFIPAFCSLTVIYDPARLSYKKLCALINDALKSTDGKREEQKKIYKIPVCYGGELGPDLHDVARLTGLSEQEVVRRHSTPDYMIYMLGFLPGFAYLGGLDRSIEVPRLDSPRTCIPQGSVGIGGSQTGIYPLDSPGGWRLIGRTPLLPYDAGREKPVLYEAGDYIRFVPITAAEYAKISEEVQKGVYSPEIIIE